MRMRAAVPEDEAKLVELMAEFYAEAGFELNRRHAAEAFGTLLADKRLGQVWLIETASEFAGYVALTFGYSMESGGRDATLEDLYIRAPFRGGGLGKGALAEMRAFCIEHGIRAVSVEVGRENDAAQEVYRTAGFSATDRQLLTLELAKPVHVA